MKKIKYGNKEKNKQGNIMEDIKGDENDICGDVLDTLNADYLSYISNLVRASKTPSKNNSKIKPPEQKGDKICTSPSKMIPNNAQDNEKKNKNDTPQSQKSVKNSTVPIRKMKKITRNSQELSTPQLNLENQNLKRYMKTEIMKEHYNRFPTQQADTGKLKEQKFEQTSIIYSQSQNNHFQNQFPQTKDFISDIDKYVMSLQSSRNINGLGRNRRKGQIRDVEQIMQQNIRLRKKVYKYEEKIQEIQENLESHFTQSYSYVDRQCKNKEKSQKKKINQLIKSLAQAVNKINQQNEQINTMKSLFAMIGRKVQHCTVQYEEESSSEVEQEINQALIKAMRPSRSYSENKMSKKKDMNAFLLNKHQYF